MKKETRRKILLYSTVILGIILAIGVIRMLLRDYYPQIHQFFNPQNDRMYLKQAFRHHGIKDACLLIILTAGFCATFGAGCCWTGFGVCF